MPAPTISGSALSESVALALLAAVQFGLALVLTQFALRHAPPAQGARASIAASALLLGGVALGWVDRAAFDWRGALVFAAIGLVFPVAVTRLTFEANRRLGPGLAGALGNVAPVFAVLGAVLLFDGALAAEQAAGLALVVGGVAALSLGRGGHFQSWTPYSLLLPLGAAAIRGLVQPLAQLGLGFWASPLAAAAIGYAVSATVARLLPGPRGRMPAVALGWYAAVGLVNGGAVLTLYAALAAGPVALVAPLVATYPLVTLGLSALMLGRGHLHVGALVGVAATVCGVMLLLAG